MPRVREQNFKKRGWSSSSDASSSSNSMCSSSSSCGSNYNNNADVEGNAALVAQLKSKIDFLGKEYRELRKANNDSIVAIEALNQSKIDSLVDNAAVQPSIEELCHQAFISCERIE